MFGVRRRWPVLTALGAALLYVVNNYQIAGLEHLHLAPLERPPQAAPRSAPNGLNDPANPGFDLTQFGIRFAEDTTNFSIDPYSPTGKSTNPDWNDLLSMGEKLAIWQDKLTGQSQVNSLPEFAAAPLIPSTSPIPFPQGLPPGLTNSSGTPSGTPSVIPPLLSPLDAIPPGTMTSTPAAKPSVSFSNTVRGANHVIRVASFKISALGTAMLNKPNVVHMIVSILRQYDVIALQGVQSSRDDVLPLVVDKLNQSGGSYDYLIGPRVGRHAPHQQFAFVFDTQKVETDRYQLYTVDDPEDLMNAEPLVAWFRCKGVPQQDAFTFSMINVSIEPSFADAERAVLPALIDAVQGDGRGEDDWILAGDFAGGNAQLTMLDSRSVRFAISDIPTDIAGTQMLDTLIFPTRATSEFTGRAGAFDFLRKYNLSLERALELSNHMPVWAEFANIEGAEPGRIAPNTASTLN